MRMHRIVKAEALEAPMVRVTFEDGLSGVVDCSDLLAMPDLDDLRDPRLFAAVAIADGGRRYGWRLDEAGREIDLCADAARISVETAIVETLAARHRAVLAAAE